MTKSKIINRMALVTAKAITIAGMAEDKALPETIKEIYIAISDSYFSEVEFLGEILNSVKID